MDERDEREGEPDSPGDVESLGDCVDDEDIEKELLIEALDDADEEGHAVALRMPEFEALAVPEVQ